MTAKLSACHTGAKCAPNDALWATPVWHALNFAVNDPHYYSYWYSGWDFGTGGTAGDKFYVRAQGDLDCNGIFSLFHRQGSVDAQGQSVQSTGSMYVFNPLE